MTILSQERLQRAALLSPCVLVGGNGKMGQWIQGLLEEYSIEFQLIEHDTNVSEQERILSSAKMVLFSVPIQSAVQIMQGLLSQIPADALVCDVTSIKSTVLAVMEKHPGEVIGLHPMCAPTSSGLHSQTVVWCKVRSERRANALWQMLTDLGAYLVELGPDEHDRLMAVVQVANHFQSFVLAGVMASCGVSTEDALRVASPIYQIRMQLMGRILAHDPAMYVDMMLHNPYAKSALEALICESGALFSSVQSGQREECIQYANRAAGALGEYRFEAQKRSEALLQTLLRNGEPQ